ncbi:hypothetical protein LSH36_623g01070 [Paralvinella palmiformis]|uniref:Uncharacterized protein n=1 Tax=Paralvinella palmiformis TaxID=53620 RepID=A0AAD9J549_9ANNE|nr:hypothetical protein LSH36_623g01070 [Paralvinella palmiformis]
MTIFLEAGRSLHNYFMSHGKPFSSHEPYWFRVSEPYWLSVMSQNGEPEAEVHKHQRTNIDRLTAESATKTSNVTEISGNERSGQIQRVCEVVEKKSQPREGSIGVTFDEKLTFEHRILGKSHSDGPARCKTQSHPDGPDRCEKQSHPDATAHCGRVQFILRLQLVFDSM